jgi:hypothetical protein
MKIKKIGFKSHLICFRPGCDAIAGLHITHFIELEKTEKGFGIFCLPPGLILFFILYPILSFYPFSSTP